MLLTLTSFLVTVFCFFVDLHRLRGLLVETWSQVQHGKTNYMVAALTTNIAMELVHKAEKELVQQFISLQSNSYADITSKIYPVNSFNINGILRATRAEDAPEIEHVATAQSQHDAEQGDGSHHASMTADQFIFTSTFHTLEKCHRYMIDVPLPVLPPIEYAYNVEPALIPGCKHWRIEDEVLSLSMLDIEIVRISKIHAAQTTKARHAGMLDQLSDMCADSKPVEDEITRALEASRVDHDRTVAQVFAARVLQDILSIGGNDMYGCYDDLLSRISAADARLEITWTWDPEKVKFGTGCEQSFDELKEKYGSRKEAIMEAYGLSQHIDHVLKHPFHAHVKGKVLSQVPGENDGWETEAKVLMESEEANFRFILPSPDLLSYPRRQPLYSGLESLKMAIKLHRIGIDLANDHLSFATMAHLYNLLRQSKSLKGQWLQMDRAIEVYKSKIFKGSLPETLDKCWRRFCLVLGVPSKYLTSTTQRELPDFKKIFSSTKNLKCKLEPLASSVHVLQYLTGDHSGEKLLYNILRENQQPRAKTAPNPTSCQLLTQLRDTMQRDLDTLDLDMISLVRSCNSLFEKIRPLARGPDTEVVDETILHYLNAGAVFTFMRELETAGEYHKIAVGAVESELGKPGFMIAADIIDEFLARGTEPEKPPPFDVLAALKVKEVVSHKPLSTKERRKLDRVIDLE